MQVPTHILSGWCVANLFPLNDRQRFGAMLAATLADLDGIGIIFSENVYWDYHHKLGHNLFFGTIVSLLLTVFTGRRIKTFILYVALFHLHLVMDYFGSGPLWKIYYLWPTNFLVFRNPDAWEFSSWQNIVAAAVMMLFTAIIAIYRGRTPIELLAPRLDRRVVNQLRIMLGKPAI